VATPPPPGPAYTSDREGDNEHGDPGENAEAAAACWMTGMDSSRHEGGADVLSSPSDLYVALGVRLRERPGARWMVEMHPRTRADFDLEAFNDRFGADDVRLYASRYVAPGEYRLSQRGFGWGSDKGPDEADYWPPSSG
jgi:hypothetical protein